MYVPFDELPDSARLWVYQAERDLTEAEQQRAAAQLRAFCEGWAAHGHPLRTSYAVAQNRFLLLAVDEAGGLPSGCSIDSSVGALRALEESLGLGLLDKARIPYRRPDGTVGIFVRLDLKIAVAESHLTPQTQVFDLTAPTVGAWRTSAVVPAGETWLRRYFATENNAR